MKAKVKPEIIKWPHGSEWMVNKTFKVVELFKKENVDMAAIEVKPPAVNMYVMTVPQTYLEIYSDRPTVKQEEIKPSKPKPTKAEFVNVNVISKCTAITKNGSQCKNKALPNEMYCTKHIRKIKKQTKNK